MFSQQNRSSSAPKQPPLPCVSEDQACTAWFGAFIPSTPPTCAAQLRPFTHPAPLYPTPTTHPLRKTDPRLHALAKAEPMRLGFRDFVPNTPSRPRRSIAAIHPLNLTLSHQTTSPLCKNNLCRHVLAKAKPTQLGFRDFIPNTPSHLRRSIAAIHPFNLTLSPPNHIPPTQKQPPPPCVSEN
jgi:hypothetical protein